MSMIENVTSDSRKATIEEIEVEGRAIWKEIEDAGVDPKNEAASEDLLRRIQSAHPDFKYSFPVLLQWMVLTKDFSIGAFRNYLRWYKEKCKEVNSREEFMRLQSEYLVFQYRYRNPRAPVGAVAEFRRSIYKSLDEETEEFKKLAEDAKKEVEELGDRADESRRQYMYEVFKRRLLEKDTSSPS